jgi:hypothetical protein
VCQFSESRSAGHGHIVRSAFLNDPGRYAIEMIMEKTLKVVSELKKKGLILDGSLPFTVGS